MRLPGIVCCAAVAIGGAACTGRGEPTEAIETRPVRHVETGFPLVGADLGASAVDYLLGSDGAARLGLSSADDYRVISLTSHAGTRHARLQQTHAGVPVWGSEIVAHADETTFLGYGGFVTTNLDSLDTNPAVTAEAALAVARADLAGGGSGASVEESRALVILPDRERGGARLAWHLELFSPPTAETDASLWSTFVDARQGAVIWTFDGLARLEQGSGPGGHPYSDRMWIGELDVQPVGGEFLMETDRLSTRDRRDGDRVVRGTDLANLPDRHANDAHGFSEIAIDMMQAWLDRDSVDDQGLPIVSLVHDVAVCPKSACWKDGAIHYGDIEHGWQRFWARSGALDVVAHEIGHGFTEFHSNLVHAEQSGGLGESFSDVTGTLAEHFHEGEEADFDIAEDIWVFSNYGAMRYMCDPTRDRQYYPGHGLTSSIEDARDFEPGMAPHFASGPPNRAFCLAVGRTMAARGIGRVAAVRELGAVWYLANSGFWTSGSDYLDGCRGTLDAARALGHANDVVRGIAHSWADVGIDCEDAVPVCEEDGTCDAGEGENCASCPADCGSCAQPCSFWKKAKCKLGIGDCSQCGDDSACGDGVCAGDETDGNCGQDCGCQAVACGEVAPFGCFCDAACEQSDDCCSDQDSCDD